MATEVEALVASVLDEYRLALNVGADSGVRDGDRVTLWRIVEVVDPVSSEKLGDVRLDKLKLTVTFVAPKYCVASVDSTSGGVFWSSIQPRKRMSAGVSDDKVTVNAGDQATIYLERAEKQS